jgi:hypothetical protein
MIKLDLTSRMIYLVVAVVDCGIYRFSTHDPLDLCLGILFFSATVLCPMDRG